MDYVIKSYFLSKNKQGTLYHTFLGVIIWSNISCMHANKMGVNTPITSSHCIAGPSTSTSEDEMRLTEEIKEVKNMILDAQEALTTFELLQASNHKHLGDWKEMEKLFQKTKSMLDLIVSDRGGKFNKNRIKAKVDNIQTGIIKLNCDTNQYILDLNWILKNKSICTKYCLELANRNLGYIQQIEIDRFSTIDGPISTGIERAKALISETETLLRNIRNNSYEAFETYRSCFLERYTALRKLLDPLKPEVIESSCKMKAAQMGKVFADKMMAQAHQKDLESSNRKAKEKQIEAIKQKAYEEKYKKFQLIDEVNVERKAKNRQVIQVNEAAQEQERIEREEQLSQNSKIKSEGEAQARLERIERHINSAITRCLNAKDQLEFQKRQLSLIKDLKKEKCKAVGNQSKIYSIELLIDKVLNLSFKTTSK